MQIAGSNCKTCGKAIPFGEDGIGCLRCTVAYHRTCLNGGTVCPQCGEDMADRAAREHAAEVEAETALLRSGRRQMQYCLVLLGALVLFNLLAPIVLGSASAFAIQPWIASIWLAGLCYWAWCGHVWARVLLAIPVVLNIVAYATMLWRHSIAAGGGATVYTIVSLACSVAVLWFLAGSRSVRFFLATQRAGR